MISFVSTCGAACSESEHCCRIARAGAAIEDIDSWNDKLFPRFRQAVPLRRECELQPGDVLFIPALWFHNVTSLGFSVALNVFWRGGGLPSVTAKNSTSSTAAHKQTKKRASQASQLYDSKDLYGNRDPPAAVQALEHAAVAAQQLAALPEPFKSFYTQRAVRQLLQGTQSSLEQVDIDACGGSQK